MRGLPNWSGWWTSSRSIPIFSQSLAARRRGEDEQQREHLYAAIEAMTAPGTQGTPTGAATIEQLCRLGGVSRAGYYRRFEERVSAHADTELRDTIQRLALEHRHYGYRRITAQLRREGWVVNTKRVPCLMRADNLLCLRHKAFVPCTTDSSHAFPIVPNLIRTLAPTSLDQIWQADITWVQLGEAFVWLAIVLDAFSRKVVGWAIADHLEALRLSTWPSPPATLLPIP